MVQSPGILSVRRRHNFVHESHPNPPILKHRISTLLPESQLLVWILQDQYRYGFSKVSEGMDSPRSVLVWILQDRYK